MAEDGTDRELAARIDENLERYSETQGVLPEKIEEFGELYRQQGYLSRDQLYRLARHASTRSAHHVQDNPEHRCIEVTRNARSIDGDFSQLQLLEGLSGFKAPIASCVVTALDPERHAVIDTRVWASLERLDRVEGRKESFDAGDYATMIQPIRSIADETGHTPAEVGYALFAYDTAVRDGTLH